jgi:hypothetical protein
MRAIHTCTAVLLYCSNTEGPILLTGYAYTGMHVFICYSGQNVSEIPVCTTVSVCVYVCMYVCMYLCMYACMYDICIHISCICVSCICVYGKRNTCKPVRLVERSMLYCPTVLLSYCTTVLCRMSYVLTLTPAANTYASMSSLYIYASMHLYIYASMHLCIYASMHLCIYIQSYIHI